MTNNDIPTTPTDAPSRRPLVRIALAVAVAGTLVLAGSIVAAPKGTQTSDATTAAQRSYAEQPDTNQETPRADNARRLLVADINDVTEQCPAPGKPLAQAARSWDRVTLSGIGDYSVPVPDGWTDDYDVESVVPMVALHPINGAGVRVAIAVVPPILGWAAAGGYLHDHIADLGLGQVRPTSVSFAGRPGCRVAGNTASGYAEVVYALTDDGELIVAASNTTPGAKKSDIDKAQAVLGGFAQVAA